MKYLLIFLCLFLAACDDLPKSGGNTGAYWYMRGWRSWNLRDGKAFQIAVIDENGEPVWRDATTTELNMIKQISNTQRVPLDKQSIDDISSRNEAYDSMPIIPIQQ